MTPFIFPIISIAGYFFYKKTTAKPIVKTTTATSQSGTSGTTTTKNNTTAVSAPVKEVVIIAPSTSDWSDDEVYTGQTDADKLNIIDKLSKEAITDLAAITACKESLWAKINALTDDELTEFSNRFTLNSGKNIGQELNILMNKWYSLPAPSQKLLYKRLGFNADGDQQPGFLSRLLGTIETDNKVSLDVPVEVLIGIGITGAFLILLSAITRKKE